MWVVNKSRPRNEFSAYVYCGQTAGWIKTALGTEVGLGPGHIVLDGDPAPLPKRVQIIPIFGPFILSPNGWMHQDATWYGGRLQPRRLCVRWGPSSPHPEKSGTAAPTLRPMSIVAKQLDGPPIGTEIGLSTGDIVWGSSISEMTYFVSTQSVYTLYLFSHQSHSFPFIPARVGGAL